MGYIANTVEITDQEHQELKDERRNQLLEPQELGEVIGNQSNISIEYFMKLYDLKDACAIGNMMIVAIEENINNYGVE